MKILLIGYGRMGRLIEQTALAAGDEIAAVVDIDTIGKLETMDRAADVAVDFSNPAALPAVAAYIRRTGTPLLSGTTGMTADDLAVLDKLGQYAPVLHSANYSIGVAVFRRALEAVSGVLKPDFDIEIVETHHNQKVDAPSGTAKMLLEAIDPNHEYTPRLWPPGHLRQADGEGDRRPRHPGRHRGRYPYGQLLRRGRGAGDHPPGVVQTDFCQRRAAYGPEAGQYAQGPV